MKLTIETVTAGVTSIAVNYTLEASEAYQYLIFEELEDKLTAEEFNKACKAIISQESVSYNKMPNVGVFLKYAKKQELDPEQQAELEAESIIDTASYPTPVLFDNEFTNAALHSYGDIGKVYFDIYDKYNHNPKSRNWVKKELKEIWLFCQINDKTSNKPSYPAISSKNDPVSFIGDKAKCQELLDSSQKLLEEKSNVQKVHIANSKMDKIIGKLEEGWKNKRFVCII